jgi:hypothetical protein
MNGVKEVIDRSVRTKEALSHSQLPADLCVFYKIMSDYGSCRIRSTNDGEERVSWLWIRHKPESLPLPSETRLADKPDTTPIHRPSKNIINRPASDKVPVHKLSHLEHRDNLLAVEYRQ